MTESFDPEAIYENWRKMGMEVWEWFDTMPPPHWNDLPAIKRAEWIAMTERARTEPRLIAVDE